MFGIDFSFITNNENLSNVNNSTKMNFASKKQNDFAKVFENANKSYDANKKTLDISNKGNNDNKITQRKPKQYQADDTKDYTQKNNHNKLNDNKDNKIADKNDNKLKNHQEDENIKENKLDENKTRNDKNVKENKIEDNKTHDNKNVKENETEETKTQDNKNTKENKTDDTTEQVNKQECEINPEQKTITDDDKKTAQYLESEISEIILTPENIENELLSETPKEKLSNNKNLSSEELLTAEELENDNLTETQGQESNNRPITDYKILLAENELHTTEKVDFAEKRQYFSNKEPVITLENKTNTDDNKNILPQNKEELNNDAQNLLNKLLSKSPKNLAENKITQQNAHELKNTSEQLLHEKVQAAEMTNKLIDELKISENKLLTQNPIKNSPEKLFNNNNDLLVKNNNVLNLQNLLQQNSKAENKTTLSDVLLKSNADIEVTSVKFEDNLSQNNTKDFNFNSSSFNNLNSHVTKLSLNKTADFSKVMQNKQTNEQQVLNQVKEATSNLSKGTTRVNIILRPENLGRVNVNLISQNGVLTAQFTAQSQQTADALNKNIETLKQNLTDQGVKVAEVSVKVQESSSSDSLMNNSNQSFEDKLGQTKEQYQSRHNHKNNFNNEFENKNNNNEYYANNSNDEEELVSTSLNHNTNNNLGLYNNMGRKL